MSEATAKAARRELRRTVGEDAVAILHRQSGQIAALSVSLEYQRQTALTDRVHLGQLQRDFSRMRVHLDGLEGDLRDHKNQQWRTRIRRFFGR